MKGEQPVKILDIVNNERDKKKTNLLISIFAYIMVFTYGYYIIRYFLLVADATYIKIQSVSFLYNDLNILLTNEDIINVITNIVDYLQITVLLGLTIVFGIKISRTQKEFKDDSKLMFVIFLSMLIIRSSQHLFLRLFNEPSLSLGYLTNETYYGYVGFDLRTDILEILLTFCMIGISSISIIVYKKLKKDSYKSFILTRKYQIIMILIYIFSHIYFLLTLTTSNFTIHLVSYYIYYLMLTMLKLGNIFLFISLSRLEINVIEKSSKNEMQESI